MSVAVARWRGPTERGKLIAGIHAQAHALQLDDETRRDLQQQLVGKESTKDMTQSQLTKVWQRLTDLAKDAGLAGRAGQARRGRPGRDERQPDEPVTPEQLEKIEELFAAIQVQDSALRMQLCRRACRNPWAQTRAEGNKIVEMLKAMAKRGWRPKKVERDVNGSVLADRAVADSPRSTRAVEPSSVTLGGEEKEKEASSTLPVGQEERI